MSTPMLACGALLTLPFTLLVVIIFITTAVPIPCPTARGAPAVETESNAPGQRTHIVSNKYHITATVRTTKRLVRFSAVQQERRGTNKAPHVPALDSHSHFDRAVQAGTTRA